MNTLIGGSGFRQAGCLAILLPGMAARAAFKVTVDSLKQVGPGGSAYKHVGCLKAPVHGQHEQDHDDVGQVLVRLLPAWQSCPSTDLYQNK